MVDVQDGLIEGDVRVPVGQPLHEGRHGAGRQAEDVCERAGVGLRPVSGEAVDGLEGLALGLREGVVH